MLNPLRLGDVLREISERLLVAAERGRETYERLIALDERVEDLRSSLAAIVGSPDNRLAGVPAAFVPGYYTPRLHFTVSSATAERAVLGINEYDLALDLSALHERDYLLNAIFHRETLDLFIAQQLVWPRSVVVDAGANIGFLSLVYAALGARRVLAIEPNEGLCARLQALSCPALEPVHLALSDSAEPRRLFLSTRHTQGHTLESSMLRLFPTVYADDPPFEEVMTITYDALLEDEGVDFVKVDIEGSELAFVEGARRSLNARRIKHLQIEIYDDFFEPVHAALSGYFDYCYVVSPSTHVYRFDVEPYTEAARKRAVRPPTYVYSNLPWPGRAGPPW